ncbi:hypothetical protein [Sphingobacterium sp. JB170]|uniref:hypothetical protein n=1 Tax=Sphingobacterium sp. JB170 TaxID=1434842 RepID=UPI001179FB09|nr:hypothetical protein [Sphingobacterium sp. JB170]
MSGSGGFGGYEPPPAAAFNCLSSSITTKLSSVDLALLPNIVIGDILEVEVNDRRTLVVLEGNGVLLGSVIHTNSGDVIACIDAGNSYEAEVVQLTPLTCTVTIRHT